MKIWVITTKNEQHRFFNATHSNDLKSVINFEVIFVENLHDLNKIEENNKVFIRTYNTKIIDYLHKLKQSINFQIIGEKSTVIRFDSNKEALKKLLRKHKIQTPKTFSLNEVTNNQVYFVKPLSEGDSIGIDEKSICYSKADVLNKINVLKKQYKSTQNIIEAFIQGKDYSVAVIKTNKKTCAYGIQINAPNSILDYETKHHNKEIYLPCTNKSVIKTALKVFKIIGAKHYARIDFRVNNQGEVYVLEVNMYPGIAKQGGYLYKCFELNTKITYENMINLIFSPQPT